MRRASQVGKRNATLIGLSGFLAAGIALALVAGCSGSTTAAPPVPSPTPAKSSQPQPTQAATGGYANPDLLVETDWLAQRLSDPSIRIVDARPASDYKAGHIKGAVNIPVDATFAPGGDAATVGAPEQIAALFGGKGIGDENKVIVYDLGKQYNASRVFWTLEYFSDKKVAVLNGGFKKWQKENREVSTDEPTVAAAKLTVKADPSRLATPSDMRAAVGKSGVAIVDARAPAEYTGDALYAKRGGHIPGAVNIDWVNLFTSDDTFKSGGDLAKIYQDKGVTKDKEVYVHCQVGMRSAVSYLTLRLLGYDKVHHYVASWEDWGNDPNTPIEK